LSFARIARINVIWRVKWSVGSTRQEASREHESKHSTPARHHHLRLERHQIKLGEGGSVLRETVKDLLGKGSEENTSDLGRHYYIDSSGVGELVTAFTSVRNQGGELKLLHLTKKVHDILQITSSTPSSQSNGLWPISLSSCFIASAKIQGIRESPQHHAYCQALALSWFERMITYVNRHYAHNPKGWLPDLSGSVRLRRR